MCGYKTELFFGLPIMVDSYLDHVLSMGSEMAEHRVREIQDLEDVE